jgi:murein DD-endopeptidase MepM/ murein hydrolase activator NlpD
MVTAFALSPSSPEEPVQLQTVLEQLTTPQASPIRPAESPFFREEAIQRSDTIFSLVSRLGITEQSAIDFIRTSPATQAIARQLRPGKVVTARTGENGELISLHFPASTGNSTLSTLVVEKTENGFAATEQALNLESHTAIKSGVINNSLFAATDAADIPDAIAIQMAEIFGGDIDFHRDLRKGDRFAIVYETHTYRGRPVSNGRILSAEFTNDQKTYTAYWFELEPGRGTYYTADGKSMRKTFLRSPLEFSRVTSGFSGARRHPVLGISRAHKGVDYGAPQGTKVRAVADAVVEFAGKQGGYGNLIILRHQGSYSTAYGHLRGFATGIQKGARVSQGDTIGYVGQTGLATGPHLHYEFRVNAHQVNPLAVSLPTAAPLAAKQIANFKATSEPLREKIEMAKQISLATSE